MKQKNLFSITFLIMLSFLLIACNGDSSTSDNGVEKTIFVGPERVDCIGGSPQECLQVREDPAEPYTLLYDPIEGFVHEVGYEYELLVLQEELSNPPADGSSIKLELLEIISKIPTNDPYPATEEIDEPSAIVSGEVVTIYVGPEMIDCTGVAEQKCLLVTSDPQGGYTMMYEPIAGFEFEPGYEYELQVLVEPVSPLPEDGSSMRYSLLEVVDKQSIAIDENLIENKIWLLQSYIDMNGSLVEVLPGSRLTAAFQQGKLIGTSGCNNYFGDYALTGGAINIEILSTPQLFCEPITIMNQEAAYINALTQAATLQLSEETLAIKNNVGQSSLLFTVEQPTPLFGTIWELQYYNDSETGLISAIEGSQTTAVFNETGFLEGLTGCNEYNASLLLDGDSLSLGPVAATATLCDQPTGIMEQESLYLGGLENVANFRKNGIDLVLFDADGERIAAFKAVDQPEALTDLPAVSEGITGNVWAWQSFTSPAEQLDILEPQNYTLELGQDGSVIILADCNSGNGEYTAEGSSMTITIFSTTLIQCPAESYSDRFIRNLNSIAGYSIENGELLLELTEGQGTMRFIPQE